MKNSTIASWINGLGVATIASAMLNLPDQTVGFLALALMVFAFIGAHRLTKTS